MPSTQQPSRKQTDIENVSDDSLESGEDAKTKRLKKNRESAKLSRLRKKQYIGQLEERNRILEKEKSKYLRKINELEER
jgi:hypothetical protein